MDRRGFVAWSGAAILTSCSAAPRAEVAPPARPSLPTQPTETSGRDPEPPTTAPTAAAAWSVDSPASAPFANGVGSGDPGPDVVTLWTALVGDTEPVTSGDALVSWEIALDPGFSAPIAQGAAQALRQDGHTLRVSVAGLPPDPLFYRFTWEGHRSPIGRTSTAASSGTSIRLGVVSCQHFEEGTFAALGALAQDEPDLVVHLGDYIYGRPGTPPLVRSQGMYDPGDLDDYRHLYRTYRRDPDLQLLHASAPVVAIWDDHEVAQNDAGTRSDRRRPDAYRAWWEQQASTIPPPDASGSLVMHRRLDLGELCRLWLLDGRQYRSTQVCRPGSLPPAADWCADLEDPGRTMLGEAQERWLLEGVVDDGRWDIVAQPTVMADTSVTLGGTTAINNDQWDGYPVARRRVVAGMAANPRSLVLSGDIHAAAAAEVRAGGVAIPEFVAPSVTTRMDPTVALGLRLVLGASRGFSLFRPDIHGYLLVTIERDRVTARLRSVDAQRPGDEATDAATWTVHAGQSLPTID